MATCVSARRSFRSREADRVFVLREKLFSRAASESLCLDGEHLGPQYCRENLFEGIRERAIDFFRARDIKWHDDPVDTSIVSSQVACVNCLMHFVDQPEALAAWLGKIYGNLDEVLPIDSASEPSLGEGRQPHLSFEWIGERNYLCERGWGKRGAYSTNGDVVLRFRQTDGKIHLVLVEWKYCESYPNPRNKQRSEKGTDRVAIYEPELEKAGCQLSLEKTPFKAMFRDPFYQLMRQQLLASAMEREKEMRSDLVSLLLVAPRSNSELLDSSLAEELACSRPALWGRFAAPARFDFIEMESLIPLIVGSDPDSDWAGYIRERYGAVGNLETGSAE